MVQRGAIRLQHISTDEQVTDILTKPLGKVKSSPSKNDMELWRGPLMRVLFDMGIELWELQGA